MSVAQRIPQSNPAAPPGALALRPYQHEALAAIEDGLGHGIRRPLVALPTGTGKTVIFSHLLRRRTGRALVLAHRDELIEQGVEKLRIVGGAGVEPGIVKAERDEHDRPLVVASVQTLARPGRLSRLARDFATIVVDEAHHAAAESYGRILTYCGAFDRDGPLVVGFTATPERGDRVGLDGVFEGVVFERSLLEMITARYLADLRAVQVRLAADFGALHTRAGDFIDGETAQLLLDADAPAHVVAAYREHAAGRRAIAFTPTVAVAHALAAAFREAGIPAEALDGTTPTPERRAILARLHSGETPVVANCAVLTEGFDEPGVSCIIVARPTRTRPLYVQMVGRGTRPYPGKADCLILDVVGATTRHDLMTTATLFGLSPDAVARETVTEALASRAAQAEAEAARGRLVARPVELFAQRRARWVQSSPTRFVLTTGQGWLALVGDGEAWRVEEHETGGARSVLADGLPLGYAQGVAEDRARTAGADALIDPGAAWRQRPDPPTEKQVAYAASLRVALPPDCTRGQASDLIAAAVDRRRARWAR